MESAEGAFSGASLPKYFRKAPHGYSEANKFLKPFTAYIQKEKPQAFTK
ncbi:MAG: hypothetical protein QNL04_14955 [SAR324 cluster bacterium]|nr:hypothetical protein [SAR324 cluster bacterium]